MNEINLNWFLLIKKMVEHGYSYVIPSVTGSPSRLTMAVFKVPLVH